MVKQEKSLTKRAQKYWEHRDLSALENMRREPDAAQVPEVLYFAGLALNALNKKREAIECWRRAKDLDPQNENAIRTLAYELLEATPVNAAELFYHLVGLQRANADDFTCSAIGAQFGSGSQGTESCVHCRDTQAVTYCLLGPVGADRNAFENLYNAIGLNPQFLTKLGCDDPQEQ